MYILWTLRRDGPLRFGVLKRQLTGVSSKVLTERLRLLESEGLVYRQHIPTIPPEVTYGLTEHGKELGGALDALEAIARRWDHRS
jgi:DNA-binding HxlR family transcriptional regulator